jgi:hypothetical protein
MDSTEAEVAAAIRALTLFGANLAFAALFAYILYETWSGAGPDAITKPVESAAAALAVALGAGYALMLGTGNGGAVREGFSVAMTAMTSIKVLGVVLYMAVGTACGVTYLVHDPQAPGIVKTVAVAFGGYVLAYIGAAYRQFSASA